MDKTGYIIHQQHGQRIYSDPNYSGPSPPPGTEVYVYRIPRDCFEDELVPVFSTCGKIYELRLMIEFSGANRSYCYVRYFDSEDARKAIRELQNYHIRPGFPLAVTQSVDNRKLCVKTVPALQYGVTESQIATELSKQVDGVLRVKWIAKRWLQIEFDSHRAAALARRLLVPGDIAIFDRVHIKQVDWADPEPDIRPAQPQAGEERVVAVSNVAAELGEAELRYWFNVLTRGQVESITYTGGGIFLITFNTLEAALYAVEKGHKAEFGGTRINAISFQGKRTSSQLEDIKATTHSVGGSYLSQVPPSPYVGPLDQLHNIIERQRWGRPHFSLEDSVSPLGQTIYRYSLSLPKISAVAVFGDWETDRGAALISCAVSTLREITQASLQSSQATISAPPNNYYR